jgi:anti-sigma factor RsiW
MTMPHATASDLGLYVMGALDFADGSRVERHVLECASCAAALAREARLEVALLQIGQRMPAPAAPAIGTPRQPPPNVAALSAVIGVFATAAALLLWVGRLPSFERSTLRHTPLEARSSGIDPPRVPRMQDAAGSTGNLDAMSSLDALDGG